MGMFYYKQTATGYSFKLEASNGATIGTSETFSSEQNCLDGIHCVQTYAPAAEIEDQTSATFKKRKHPKYELYLDKAKEFRFRLTAKNGETILTSPGYSSKTNCMDAIDNVQSGALNAKIIQAEV